MIFVFDSIPDRYKTQKMCDRVVSEDPFLIVHCPDKYKTQRMCDKAIDEAIHYHHQNFPIGLLQVKLKNFILHCTQKKIYSTLMKILVMLYFLVMKWIFLL